MCWLSIDLPAGLNECLTCSVALREAEVSDERGQESDRGWAVLVTLKVFFLMFLRGWYFHLESL